VGRRAGVCSGLILPGEGWLSQVEGTGPWLVSMLSLPTLFCIPSSSSPPPLPTLLGESSKAGLASLPLSSVFPVPSLFPPLLTLSAQAALPPFFRFFLESSDSSDRPFNGSGTHKP